MSMASRCSAGRTALAGLTLCTLLVVSVACGSSSDTASNDGRGCVKHYQPGSDLFPTKATATHAHDFTLTYHDNYKVLTVRHAGENANRKATYVLVQCGTPAPRRVGALAHATVLTVPVQRVVVSTTTEMAAFEILGTTNRVVGIDTTKYLTGKAALARAPKLKQFAPNGTPSAEVLLDADPDIVIDDGFSTGLSSTTAKAKLPDLLDGSNQEQDPLGRAEWLKAYAALTNQEQTANADYDQVVKGYDGLKAKTAGIAPGQRPLVMSGFVYEGRWAITGGKSYAANYLADAGARYTWADNPSTGPSYVSLEAELGQAHDADFWLNGSMYWKSRQNMLSEEPRYRNFKSWQTGQVWNNDKGANQDGGQPYQQEGTYRPDLVLGDLIAILHPDLLPQHHFAYYRKLPAG